MATLDKKCSAGLKFVRAPMIVGPGRTETVRVAKLKSSLPSPSLPVAFELEVRISYAALVRPSVRLCCRVKSSSGPANSLHIKRGSMGTPSPNGLCVSCHAMSRLRSPRRSMLNEKKENKNKNRYKKNQRQPRNVERLSFPRERG